MSEREREREGGEGGRGGREGGAAGEGGSERERAWRLRAISSLFHRRRVMSSFHRRLACHFIGDWLVIFSFS